MSLVIALGCAAAVFIVASILIERRRKREAKQARRDLIDKQAQAYKVALQQLTPPRKPIVWDTGGDWDDDETDPKVNSRVGWYERPN